MKLDSLKSVSFDIIDYAVACSSIIDLWFG